MPEEARHCLGRANAVTHRWLFSQCCNSALAFCCFQYLSTSLKSLILPVQTDRKVQTLLIIGLSSFSAGRAFLFEDDEDDIDDYD